MHRAIDRLATLRVRDVMTRQVFCVRADQTLNEVADFFSEKGISSAPVVNEEGACVGVLSFVDFLKRRQRSPQAAGQASPSAGAVPGADNGVKPLSVRDCMTERIASIGPDELLLLAAQTMCARHVHRLPVLGDNKRLEGLISTMDIVAAMVKAIDEAEASHFKPRA